MELNYSGFAAVGTSIREINYPDGVLNLFVCGDGQHTWLLLVKQMGGELYDCDLANSSVKQLLRNSSDSYSEIKRLCHYDAVIVFTDIRR